MSKFIVALIAAATLAIVPAANANTNTYPVYPQNQQVENQQQNEQQQNENEQPEIENDDVDNIACPNEQHRRHNVGPDQHGRNHGNDDECLQIQLPTPQATTPAATPPASTTPAPTTSSSTTPAATLPRCNAYNAFRYNEQNTVESLRVLVNGRRVQSIITINGHLRSVNVVHPNAHSTYVWYKIPSGITSMTYTGTLLVTSVDSHGNHHTTPKSVKRTRCGQHDYPAAIFTIGNNPLTGALLGPAIRQH